MFVSLTISNISGAAVFEFPSPSSIGLWLCSDQRSQRQHVKRLSLVPLSENRCFLNSFNTQADQVCLRNVEAYSVLVWSNLMIWFRNKFSSNLHFAFQKSLSGKCKFCALNSIEPNNFICSRKQNNNEHLSYSVWLRNDRKFCHPIVSIVKGARRIRSCKISRTTLSVKIIYGSFHCIHLS